MGPAIKGAGPEKTLLIQPKKQVVTGPPLSSNFFVSSKSNVEKQDLDIGLQTFYFFNSFPLS